MGERMGERNDTAPFTEFEWVPSWLSDPPPPTSAAHRGAETLRKLPTPHPRDSRPCARMMTPEERREMEAATAEANAKFAALLRKKNAGQR